MNILLAAKASEWGFLGEQLLFFVVSGLAVYLVKALARYITEKTDNDFLKAVSREFERAARDGVLYAQQVYVDNVKKRGEWSPMAAEEAFAIAFDAAKSSISKKLYAKANDILSGTIQNVGSEMAADEILKNLVEAMVKVNKDIVPSELVEVETLEQ